MNDKLDLYKNGIMVRKWIDSEEADKIFNILRKVEPWYAFEIHVNKEYDIQIYLNGERITNEKSIS